MEFIFGFAVFVCLRIILIILIIHVCMYVLMYDYIYVLFMYVCRYVYVYVCVHACICVRHCMHICQKRGLHLDPKLFLDKIPIPVVEETKFLGAIFDRKLLIHL